MYASLHKVDIALSLDEEDDVRIAVQTDHRETDQMARNPELSIIFGLTRALNPTRSGQFICARFTFQQPPTAALRHALLAAGAEVEYPPGADPEVGVVDVPTADAVAAAALRQLGLRLLRERELEPVERSLNQLQTEYAARAAVSGGPDDDPLAYWTAVVELGAITGVVIHASHGHDWVRDPEFFGMIPFMLGHDGSLTNVFGKVERYFQEGPAEAPTTLLKMIDDLSIPDEDEGAMRVLTSLRPSNWSGIGMAAQRPLLTTDMEGADIPVVALVQDLPHTTRTLSDDLDDDQVMALEREALANLAAIEVEVTELDGIDVPVLVTHGDYYAAEKILDPDHMHALHARLGSQLLLAAVPARGQLWTTSAMIGATLIGQLAQTVAEVHDQTTRAEQISRELFLVRDGDVVGVASLSGPRKDDPEPRLDQGFWARLLGL